MAILLLAVAVLQIYGQQLNNRDRLKTKDERERADKQRVEADKQRDDENLERAKQTALIINLLSEIAKKR